jgi:hypothetical protein
VKAFVYVGNFIVLQAPTVAVSADASVCTALLLLASQHLELSQLNMVIDGGELRKCQLRRFLCSPFVIRQHVVVPNGAQGPSSLC